MMNRNLLQSKINNFIDLINIKILNLIIHNNNNLIYERQQKLSIFLFFFLIVEMFIYHFVSAENELNFFK